MHIAKPPDGFLLCVPPPVIQSIEALCDQWPDLKIVWPDIQNLLRMTGHKIGRPSPKNNSIRVIKIPNEDWSVRVPTLFIAYSVLGEVLTFHTVVAVV